MRGSDPASPRAFLFPFSLFPTGPVRRHQVMWLPDRHSRGLRVLQSGPKTLKSSLSYAPCRGEPHDFATIWTALFPIEDPIFRLRDALRLHLASRGPRSLPLAVKSAALAHSNDTPFRSCSLRHGTLESPRTARSCIPRNLAIVRHVSLCAGCRMGEEMARGTSPVDTKAKW
jgi:hypothetical protein